MGFFKALGSGLSAIVSPIANIVGTYLQSKTEVMKAKTENQKIGLQADADVKVANATAAAKMAETGQMQTYDLDRIAMEQMKSSWWDEFMIFILLMPVIASFVGYAEEVAVGFKAFAENMPEWFQYLIIGVYVVKFGMRGLLDKLLTRKIGIPKAGAT